MSETFKIGERVIVNGEKAQVLDIRDIGGESFVNLTVDGHVGTTTCRLDILEKLPADEDE